MTFISTDHRIVPHLRKKPIVKPGRLGSYFFLTLGLTYSRFRVNNAPAYSARARLGYDGICLFDYFLFTPG